MLIFIVNKCSRSIFSFWERL